MTLRCRRPLAHMARMNRIAILPLPLSRSRRGAVANNGDVLSRIRTEGMEHSQAAAVFDT